MKTVQTVLLLVVNAVSWQPAEPQEPCPSVTPALQLNRSAQAFVPLWSRDPDDPFSEQCCGDLFQCAERRPTCLRCGAVACDALTQGRPGCPDDDCHPFGLVCDGRPDCRDGADEMRCDDVKNSFQASQDQGISVAAVILYGVSLETCAAYCFYHSDSCLVFSYSRRPDSGSFEGVTQSHQLVLGRPVYSSECWIGCTACGLRRQPRPGFTVYQANPATSRLRLDMQKSPPPPDPADDLLPRYPVCGRRSFEPENVRLVDRVVDAEPVLYGEYPWQAQIKVWNNDLKSHVHHCGGVIVSDRFVLTAAHCMTRELGDYEVVVGQFDLRRRDTSEASFAIRNKVNHPEYIPERSKVGDLSILRLNVKRGPIHFSLEVQPVCLIRPSDPAPAPAPHLECLISGWGKLLPLADRYPERLRGGPVPLVSDQFCSSPDVYGDDFVPEKMICAGDVEGGTDTCQGDSGGGLVCRGSDDVWRVVGIVATGGTKCGAAAKPGIYTELQPYFDKIVEIMLALDT